MRGMWRMCLPSGRNAEALALEARANRARCALACAYSSAAEFEADVIKARRQAGAYGLKRQGAVVAVAVATALVATVAFVVPF